MEPFRAASDPRPVVCARIFPPMSHEPMLHPKARDWSLWSHPRITSLVIVLFSMLTLLILSPLSPPASTNPFELATTLSCMYVSVEDRQNSKPPPSCP